jgi:hypothetical protein
MKGDSGVVLAGRLLVKAAPSFCSSTGVPKQELARTLNAISINLAEIAEALRLGVLPIPSSAQLRAKTITLIIVVRQVAPEEVAREIARQLVSCTRIGGFASGSRFRKAKRKASGYWPSRFSWIPPIFRCFRRS